MSAASLEHSNGSATRAVGRPQGGERGLFLCLVGPDGSGKSTLAREYVSATTPTPEHRYWRPGVLPRPGRLVGRPEDGETINVDPHGKAPHGRARAWFRTIYYLVDFSLGYWLVVRPTLRRGRDFVLERGWQDTAVDPRRYQLRGNRLVRALSALVPRPDVVVLLAVPPEVISTRKQEITTGEMTRQTDLWRRTARSRLAMIELDGTLRPDDLVTSVASELMRVRRSRPGSRRAMAGSQGVR